MKNHKKQSTTAVPSAQDKQQELVAAGLRLPGVEEAFAIYGKALQSFPFRAEVSVELYATDVNNATLD